MEISTIIIIESASHTNEKWRAAKGPGSARWMYCSMSDWSIVRITSLVRARSLERCVEDNCDAWVKANALAMLHSVSSVAATSADLSRKTIVITI